MSSLLVRDSEMRILWISDIHISTAYNQFDKFQKFITHFIEFYSKQKGRFDYILVTGDIAFSGISDEFDMFLGNFALHIYAYHQSVRTDPPKILTIPGNHDICRQDADIFFEYMKENKPRTNRQLNDFFNNKTNQQDILDTFKNYSNKFGNRNDNSSDEVWKSMFSLEGEHLEVCEAYDDHRLFGYFIDHKKKTVFVFINSAWASLGSKYDEWVIKDHINNYGLKELDIKTGKKLLAEKESFHEYGNQLIGRVLLNNNNDLLNKLNVSKDYTVITAMHHPLNWLHWAEQYDYTKGGSFIINQILDKTDLLLTGHEHVPINVPVFRANEGYIHLKAGMFCDDKLNKPEYDEVFQHNCLSILEQRYVGREQSVTQLQYLYDRTKGWELYRSPQPIYNKIKSRILSREEVGGLFNWYRHLPVKELINKLLDNRYTQLTSFDSIDDHEYKVVRGESDREIVLFVIATGAKAMNIFFPETIDNNSNKYIFDPYLDGCYEMAKKTKSIGKYGERRVKIHFITVDLLVGQKHSDEYFSVPIDKQKEAKEQEITTRCMKFSDQLFNLFRFRYYRRFQDEKDEKAKGFFSRVRNLIMINQVIPVGFLYDYRQETGAMKTSRTKTPKTLVNN